MTDNELIIQVKNGNTHAFRFLVERHKNLVWHMAIRMVRQDEDAEDLCQEVFMRVFKDINRFRGDAKLSTWIGSITYNVCVDYIRKKGREKVDIYEDPESYLGNEPASESPAGLLNTSELKACLNKIVENLPLQFRTVITLFHLEEMSYKEIGEITGMPEGTIKSYLNRGRQLIHNEMLKLIPDIHPVLFEKD